MKKQITYKATIFSIKIVLVQILFISTFIAFGATNYSSYDTSNDADWISNGTWNGSATPGNNVPGNKTVTINGSVISYSDLSFGMSTSLTISSGATLIVDGTITNSLFGSVVIETGGTLVVLDSYSGSLLTGISNNGLLVVVGDVSQSAFSYTDNTGGELYVLGSFNQGFGGSTGGNTISEGDTAALVTNQPDLIDYLQANFPGSIPDFTPYETPIVADPDRIYAIADGNWSTTSIWSRDGYAGTSCNCVPDANDTVYIQGYTVNADITTSIQQLLITNASDANLTSQFKILTGVILNVSGDVILENISSTNAVFLKQQGTSQLTIGGNLKLNGSFPGNNYVELLASSIASISGNIESNIYGDIYILGDAQLQSSNAAPNTFYQSIGNISVSYENISLTNGGSYYTSGNVTITGSLTMSNGILHTDASNLLILEEGATISGGSDISHIEGPIRRNTSSTSETIFPIGDGGIYAPLGIALTSATASTYTAEYFTTPYSDINTIQSESGIVNISTVEYWDIHQNSGVGVNVTMYYLDVVRSSINDITQIVLAHWTGTEWENLNRISNTANSVTAGPMTSFSPITAGGASGSALPVELVDFTASYYNGEVNIEWATASEKNNDYFTIERSLDGIFFDEIAVVEGIGNSSVLNVYNATDYEPLAGEVYYRLKQTDFDGTTSYSKVVAVRYNLKLSMTKNTMKVYPNPLKEGDDLSLTLITTEDVTIEVFNSNGTRLYFDEYFTGGEPEMEVEVDFIMGFPSGNYIVKASTVTTSLFENVIIK